MGIFHTAALRMPSVYEDKLAAGVTDPWVPANWLAEPLTTTFIHQRVSEFNSEVRCLPRGKAGNLVCVVNAGDGGGVRSQTGILDMTHMDPAYDPGQGGDNTFFLGFYMPGQKIAHLMPADCIMFRQDEGHVSYRAVFQTMAGRLQWSLPDQLALCGVDTFVAAAGAQQPGSTGSAPDLAFLAAWQSTTSRLYVDTTAGAATFDGLPPPPSMEWDGAAYQPFGGALRVIWNLGPNTLTIPRLSGGGTAGWQFLPAASIVLQPFDSVWMMYEPFGSGFWTIPRFA